MFRQVQNDADARAIPVLRDDGFQGMSIQVAVHVLVARGIRPSHVSGDLNALMRAAEAMRLLRTDQSKQAA